jgi:predicted nicotinamide N-methyase
MALAVIAPLIAVAAIVVSEDSSKESAKNVESNIASLGRRLEVELTDKRKPHTANLTSVSIRSILIT